MNPFANRKKECIDGLAEFRLNLAGILVDATPNKVDILYLKSLFTVGLILSIKRSQCLKRNNQ